MRTAMCQVTAACSAGAHPEGKAWQGCPAVPAATSSPHLNLGGADGEAVQPGDAAANAGEERPLNEPAAKFELLQCRQLLQCSSQLGCCPRMCRTLVRNCKLAQSGKPRQQLKDVKRQRHS